MLVQLEIDGLKYDGWKAISISKSLENVASGFTLSVSEDYPSFGEQIAIRPAKKCVILVDGVTLITGYVDKVSLSYDGTSHDRTISGRTKTGDLVDCSVQHSSGQFRNQKISQIARTLAGTYGIDIFLDGLDDSVITDFQIENGERVFSAIERLARQRNFLCTDTPDGQLRLIHEPSTRAYDALKCVAGGEDNNILSGSVDFDVSARYSSIEVRSQAEGTDTSFGDAVNRYTATANDLTIDRDRTLIKILETAGSKKDCEKRAKWEVAARVGASTNAKYQVQGWQQSNGDLWLPSLVVSVSDDFANLNTDMVIVSCQYELSDSGIFTTLELVPPEAFEIEPTIQKKAETNGLWDEVTTQ